MSYNGFAIDQYLDAAAVTKQLDELIKKPVYSIRKDKLAEYESEYFDKKCARSKEMITKAKEVIPGGVQHNLAFNHPFPIVITKAEGAKLYDLDGNEYYDLLQAGGHKQGGTADGTGFPQPLIGPFPGPIPETALFHFKQVRNRDQEYHGQSTADGLEGKRFNMIHAHTLGNKGGTPDYGSNQKAETAFEFFVHFYHRVLLYHKRELIARHGRMQLHFPGNVV